MAQTPQQLPKKITDKYSVINNALYEIGHS